MIAAVVFALSFGLVGFKTEDVPGGLDIVFRFGDVVLVTLLAFLGRVAVILLRAGRAGPVLFTAVPFGLMLISLLLYVHLLARYKPLRRRMRRIPSPKDRPNRQQC